MRREGAAGTKRLAVVLPVLLRVALLAALSVVSLGALLLATGCERALAQDRRDRADARAGGLRVEAAVPSPNCSEGGT